MRSFVLELGVEEIPSAYLRGLMANLYTGAEQALKKARLEVEDMVADGTPRRLSLRGQVAERQTPLVESRRGPAIKVGLDAEGRPTPAAYGFARRVGVSPDALTPGEGVDANYLVAVVESPVEEVSQVLPRVFEAIVLSLAPPRSMRWASTDVRFIRPVRWVLALLEEEVMPVTLFERGADRVTYGNRTDHPGPVTVDQAKLYVRALTGAGVELSRDARKGRILAGGEDLASAAGGHLEGSEELLDEVADLVEWPVPFLGHFDREYLDLPAPVLTTTMEKHQRYFPVSGESGLLPVFVGVRNGQGEDLAQVVAGNERVLKARLEDARFFYQEDLKSSLEERLPKISAQIYQAGLGTYGDKIARMRNLARAVAPRVGLMDDEAALLDRATWLAKADLVSHVVGEFPELQGVMGGHYAGQQGEPTVVVEAIADQYHPASAQDRLPDTRVGQVLALVDRLDNLAGAEVAALRPTGSEDPFALRRQALGVARILMAGDLTGVAPEDVVGLALAEYGSEYTRAVPSVVEFIRARIRAWLSDEYRVDLVDACLMAQATWDSLLLRVQHLAGWSGASEFEQVLTTFKRVINLAKDNTPRLLADYPDERERQLADRVREAMDTAASWDLYWKGCASLSEPVSQFMQAVLVMDPDPSVRARRLSLLAMVGQFLLRGADLTRVTGERRE